MPTVVMTLDSGADVSVAPENFYALGMPTSRTHMVDAQGERIQSGNRRLRLVATAKDGATHLVEFVEQFALGQGATHPLLSLGLLRQGWVLSRDRDELLLEHRERSLQIPARLERNSLVMEVQVCAVRSEEDDDVTMEEKECAMPPEVAGSKEEKRVEDAEKCGEPKEEKQ